MIGEPCLNPNCKSHGKPHPNCRCYGNFAEGGEVSDFCSNNLPHNKMCKHYAGGGDVDLSKVMQHKDPAASVSSYLSHSGLHGLLDLGQDASDQSVIKYNQAIKHGHKNLHSKVDSLFQKGKSDATDTTKSKKKIEDWLDKGGVTDDLKEELYKQNVPTKFAEGGKVEESKGVGHDHHIAQAYPSQNVMLQTAKGRMSHYLSDLRPQKNTPKLAFDHVSDTRRQEKSYQHALHLAADPLSVLDKVKSGTIEAEHVKHFNNLYPEVNHALQKKLTERITHAQLKGERPDYHIRQGMSLLLGTPLSGEMLPQNIRAAQATFKSKQEQTQEQGQSPTKNKKNTSSLTKADQAYLTSNEARTARQQKQ